MKTNRDVQSFSECMHCVLRSFLLFILYCVSSFTILHRLKCACLYDTTCANMIQNRVQSKNAHFLKLHKEPAKTIVTEAEQKIFYQPRSVRKKFFNHHASEKKEKKRKKTKQNNNNKWKINNALHLEIGTTASTFEPL